jgi:predicted RNase H-like nuclease (RuvC/YqgF family)
MVMSIDPPKQSLAAGHAALVRLEQQLRELQRRHPQNDVIMQPWAVSKVSSDVVNALHVRIVAIQAQIQTARNAEAQAHSELAAQKALHDAEMSAGCEQLAACRAELARVQADNAMLIAENAALRQENEDVAQDLKDTRFELGDLDFENSVLRHRLHLASRPSSTFLN